MDRVVLLPKKERGKETTQKKGSWTDKQNWTEPLAPWPSDVQFEDAQVSDGGLKFSTPRPDRDYSLVGSAAEVCVEHDLAE
jgi:hypothetical protein